MTKSRYEAIHFDMDGVIADTEAFHVAAEKQTCVEYGFEVDMSEWDGFKGRTAPDIFDYLIRSYGNPRVHKVDELVAHKTGLFVTLLQDKLTPIDGVTEFLQWAREAHRTMTLVTSSNRNVQQFIIERLKFSEMFDAVVTGDEVMSGKPSPEPYLRAIGKAGLRDSRRSVVVEDSISGIASGLSAGCDVLAITTSHDRETLAAAAPTYIVHDYVAARSALANG